MIARWFPSADLLNLTFGLSVGVAINLLTAGTLGGLAPNVFVRVQLEGWSFLVGSVLVGTLAIIVNRVSLEALAGVGPTLSSAERRAQVTTSLETVAIRLGVIAVAASISFGIGLVGFMLT